MTNRRGFLSALAGVMVLDPERLLWVPGQKHISIPKPVRPRPRYIINGIVCELREITTGYRQVVRSYYLVPIGKQVGFSSYE